MPPIPKDNRCKCGNLKTTMSRVCFNCSHKIEEVKCCEKCKFDTCINGRPVTVCENSSCPCHSKVEVSKCCGNKLNQHTNINGIVRLYCGECGKDSSPLNQAPESKDLCRQCELEGNTKGVCDRKDCALYPESKEETNKALADIGYLLTSKDPLALRLVAVRAILTKLISKARTEAKREYLRFILNILDGIDEADRQAGNKGGGTLAIRHAIMSRIID